ncbi:hypothetical protein ACFVXQ_13400, partial [Kitasatospora sp. NPDC058263]
PVAVRHVLPGCRPRRHHGRCGALADSMLRVNHYGPAASLATVRAFLTALATTLGADGGADTATGADAGSALKAADAAWESAVAAG